MRVVGVAEIERDIENPRVRPLEQVRGHVLPHRPDHLCEAQPGVGQPPLQRADTQPQRRGSVLDAHVADRGCHGDHHLPDAALEVVGWGRFLPQLDVERREVGCLGIADRLVEE